MRQEKRHVPRHYRVISGLCVVAAAGLLPAGTARAGVASCQTFLDAAAFEQFLQANDKMLKGVEDFEPPVSNLLSGDFAVLADPLEAGVPNLDGILGFEAGLSNGNLVIQSNGTTEHAPEILPGGGLVALGPDFFAPGVPNSVKVGALFFDDSVDLIFTSEPAITAVGFTAEDPSLGIVEISVFNTLNEEIFTGSFVVPVGQAKLFFGIWCDQAIGRVNVGGPGAEIVDDVQMWLPSVQDPVCPWDCGLPANATVGIVDFLALLGQWGMIGTSCDLDGEGVGITDFLAVLGHWGPCPAPDNDECAAMIQIDRIEPDGSIVEPFDMFSATASTEDSQCLGGPNTHQDLWYCLTNSTGQDKLVTITSSVALVIEITAGCTCPPAALVACLTVPAGDGSTIEMSPGEQVTLRLINHLDLPNDQLGGTLTITNGPIPPVNFFLDQAAFDSAVLAAGKLSKFTWDFNPNDLPAGDGVLLDDPLDVNTHDDDPDDPWALQWPADVDNVQFSSNTNPAGPFAPRIVNGLAFLGAGFENLTSDLLSANVFVDSFDVVSGPPAGDSHTAMSLGLVSLSLSGVPTAVLFRVTVYDEQNIELGSIDIPAIDAETVFLGILMKDDATIGRVDIWDVLGNGINGGVEGISTITTYIEGLP